MVEPIPAPIPRRSRFAGLLPALLTLIPLLILGAHIGEQREKAGERQRRNWLRLTDGPARRLAQASRLEFWLERQSGRFRREAERRLAAGEPMEAACQAAGNLAGLPGLPTPVRWVVWFPDPALEMPPRPVAGPTVPWLSRRLAGELLHEAARFLTGRPGRLSPSTLEARLNRVFGFGATEGLLRPDQRGLAFWAMAGGISRLAVWDCLTVGGRPRGAVLTLIDPGDHPGPLALRLAIRHWRTLSGRPRPGTSITPRRQEVAPAPGPAAPASPPPACTRAGSTSSSPLAGSSLPPDRPDVGRASPLPPRMAAQNGGFTPRKAVLRAPLPRFLPAFLPWPSPPDLPREPVLAGRSCPPALRAVLTIQARRMQVTPGRAPPRYGPFPAPAFPPASWNAYPRSGKIRLEGLRFGEVLDLGQDAVWWGRFVLLDANTGHVGMVVGRRPALPATPDRLALFILASLWLFAWAPALGRPGSASNATGGGIRRELVGWFLGLAAIPLALGTTSAFRFLDDLRDNLLAGARQSLEERVTTLENQAAELAARPAATLIHLSRQAWVGPVLQAWQLASGPASTGSTPLDRLWSEATAAGVPLTSLQIVGHGGFSRFRAVSALSRAEQTIQSRLGAAMGGVMLKQMAPDLAARFPAQSRDPLTASLQDSIRVDALNQYQNDISGNFFGAGRKKVREDHVVVRIDGLAWFVLVYCWDPRQESRRALRESLLARAGAEGPEQAFDADSDGGLVAVEVSRGGGWGGEGEDALAAVARMARAGPFAWIREGGRAAPSPAPVTSPHVPAASASSSSLLVLARPAVRLRGFVLAAAMRLAPLEARLARERTLIWGTLLGMVLLVTVGGALLSGWLASPLVQITAALREVKEGRRRFEVAGERHDQLGEAVGTLQRMVGWLRERETIGRFVSSHVLEIVSQGDETGAAQGRTREVVLLVSDIRSFTTLSERHPPKDIFQLLNDHLGAMTPAIQAHGGTIDRFIGDAIQAAFFPADGDHAATRAARAACAMMREHRRLNAGRLARGTFPYAIGIGLARGEAITGVLGDPDVRLDFTVLGEPLREAHEREAASKDATTTFIIAGPELLPFLDGDMETLPVPGHPGLVEILHPSLPPLPTPASDPQAPPSPDGAPSGPGQPFPSHHPAVTSGRDPSPPASGTRIPDAHPAAVAPPVATASSASPPASPAASASHPAFPAAVADASAVPATSSTTPLTGPALAAAAPPVATASSASPPASPAASGAVPPPLPGGAPIRIGGWLPVLATVLLWIFALALLWWQVGLLAGRSAENEQALLERRLREEAGQLAEIYTPERASTMVAEAELDRLAEEVAAVPAAARPAFLSGPVAERLEGLAGRLGASAWFLMENVRPDLPPTSDRPFSTAILAEGGPAVAARRRFAQVLFASFRDVMGGLPSAPLLEKVREGLFQPEIQPGQCLEDLFCEGLGAWLVIGNPPARRFLWQPLICLASHSRIFPGHLYWDEFPAAILLFREGTAVTPEEGLSALEQAFAARGLSIGFEPPAAKAEGPLGPQGWPGGPLVPPRTGPPSYTPAENDPGGAFPGASTVNSRGGDSPRASPVNRPDDPSLHLAARLPDGPEDRLNGHPAHPLQLPNDGLVVRTGRLPDGTGFRLAGKVPLPADRVGYAFLATLTGLARGWGWLGAALLTLALLFPRTRVGLTPRLVVAFLAILAPALLVGAALLERAAIEKHFRLERGFPTLLAARVSHLEDSLRALVGAQIHLFRRRLASTDTWLARPPGQAGGPTFGDGLQWLYEQGMADGSSFVVVTGLERGGVPEERPLNPDQEAPDGGRRFFGDMFRDVLERLPAAAGPAAAPAGADPGADPGAVLSGAKAEEIRDVLLVLMDAGELAGFVGAPVVAARQRTGNFSQHSYRAFLGPPHDRRGVILTHWIAKAAVWQLFNHLCEQGVADVRLARRDHPSMVLEPPFFFPYGPRDDLRTVWAEHQRIGNSPERWASWLSTRGEGKVLARTGAGASATLLLAYTGEEATDLVLLAEEPVGRHLAAHWLAIRGHRWLLAVLLAITCLLAAQVARRLLAPLLVFTGTVDRFMRREFTVRLPIDRDDEFGHLAAAFNAMADGVEEVNRLRRFVSESVRGVAADRAREESARHGEQRTVVVLFAGLPGFKDLLHDQDPASLVVHLNRFLQAMSREIRAQGGEIDKFIGDKILAVFDPASLGGSPAAAAAAVRAAGRMTAALSALSGFPISRLGVGVVHGPVLSGILGTPLVRQEFTVIGDTVNLASRLCDLALAQPAAGVVAEAEVVRQAATGGGHPVSAFTRLAVSQVKGKSRSVEAFLFVPPHDS
ncbi:MAG: HAMP domain-containing protein [Candidatus Riflebacteria bacterium]|nr:HAMP domain-containing protein [Candidatus Riflebacteria bacterium]